MKTPLPESMHDLHQCFQQKDPITNKVIRKWVVATIAYNLPYKMQRRKAQVLKDDPRYPNGTFFVITENGKRPKL